MATHYLITNREITDRKGTGFIAVNDKEYIRTDGDEEAQHNLRYGTVTFDPGKARRLKDFKIKIMPEPGEGEMERYAETGDDILRKKLPSAKMFEALHNKSLKATKAGKRQDILFFVHGFRSDLETAMQTLQRLHEKYVTPQSSPIRQIVLFTWPARKKMMRYRSDAFDAVQSGFALARSYASLKQFFRSLIKNEEFCEQRIHMMCHSMGVRVLESMLIDLHDMGVEIQSTFSEIMLIGADVDYDAIEQPKPLYRLIDFGERVHVYYHNKDRALGVSEITKNAFNRLGRWGARNSLNLADDIYQANVTHISDDRGLIHGVAHHWYYYNSDSVVRDITEVFNGEESVFTLL